MFCWAFPRLKSGGVGVLQAPLRSGVAPKITSQHLPLKSGATFRMPNADQSTDTFSKSTFHVPENFFRHSAALKSFSLHRTTGSRLWLRYIATPWLFKSPLSSQEKGSGLRPRRGDEVIYNEKNFLSTFRNRLTRRLKKYFLRELCALCT